TTADRDAGDSKAYTIDSAGTTSGSFDINGTNYQQKLVGNFGTLYLANSGAYEYVPNDSAIEALEANTSEGFTLKVTDGSGATDTKTLTISLTGAQDAPEVTAVVAGYTDTAADNTFADTVGTLSVSSRDGDTSFTFALAGSSDSLMSGYDRQDASSNFGTLYLNSSTGAYKFVANDAAIEALEAGNNPSAIYHVTASADGIASPSQTITINLTGAEDAPVVAPVVASYTDTAADNTFADTVGTLSVTSRDGDTSFSFALAGSSSSPLPGYDRQDASSTYGTLYLNSTTGAYKFVANDAAIEALEAGNNPSAIYHVTAAADGATSTSQTITFNFTGAEDAPVVAPVVASYTDTAADDTFNDTLGTLSVSSRDGDTSFTFALAGSTTTGQLDYNLQNTSSGYGTLYLNSSTGAYKFVANDAAIEALQWGANPNLVYNVTAAADGVTSANQTITIGITGGNDAPRDLTLTADTSNSFVTGNGVPGNNGAIGTISVTTGTDVDGGGAYTYSLFSAKSGALGAASIITDASAQFAVSAAGALSTPTGLASGTIYEVTVQASQGTGSAQATYNETFSIVTGTNAGTESLPGGGYDFRSGDDVIYGRQNVDIIVAGSGNDTVFGQDGDDEIYGGTGVDLLYGGKDNDSFVFSTGDTGITLATADTIGDFNSANDTIVTSLNAGNVTIANGSGLADFNAFVAAANTVMASGSATNGAYMAWNAAGSGNGWLVIDENQNHSVDTGDTLIVLTGVNAANAFSTTDIA
ncbi:calcium-binding protein, partial [Pseudomonas sp. 30_B]|uniref:beta strand repeat-containing protein n=1 Tax=Pseudomonas sp. 30_B TaxID=2813575 RepID=UPI001A9E64B5